MPSLFSITLAVLPSITATQEFVVPRSIPMTLLMDTSFQKQDRAARGSTVPIPRKWLISHPLTLQRYICQRSRALQRLGRVRRAGLRRLLRDPDHGRAQQAVVQHITGLQDLDDRAGRLIRRARPRRSPGGNCGRSARLAGRCRRMPCRSKTDSSSRSVAATPASRLRVRSSPTSASGRLSSARRRLSAAESRSLAKPVIAYLVGVLAFALSPAAGVLGLGKRPQQPLLVVRELGFERRHPLLGRASAPSSALLFAAVLGCGRVRHLAFVSSVVHSSYPMRRPITLAV